MDFKNEYIFNSEYDECIFGFHFSILQDRNTALTPYLGNTWEVGKRCVIKSSNENRGFFAVPLQYWNPFGFYEIQCGEWCKHNQIPILLSVLEYTKADIINECRQVALFRPLNPLLPLSLLKSETELSKANIIHESIYDHKKPFTRFYEEIPCIIQMLEEFAGYKREWYKRLGKDVFRPIIHNG